MEEFLHEVMLSPFGGFLRWGARFLAPVVLFAAFLGVRRMKSKKTSAGSAAGRIVILGVFVLLLGYQASWQLAGSFRPRFMTFMRRYSPRPDSPEKHLRRGRILSADGVVLADNHAEWPGQRIYPLKEAAGHVVGYADSRFGLSGMEGVADGRLSGYTVSGMEDLDRVARSMIDRRNLSGADVRLTLDSRLQRKAFDMLSPRAGAVVGIDPRNGAVLVLASSPGFDPENIATELKKPGSSMLNRALHGLYPPGSSFKTLVAAMALEAGLPLIYDCPAGGYRAAAGVPAIHDHGFYSARREGRKWSGYGRLNLEQAFSRSSNTYFAQLGVAGGADRFNRMAEGWGLRKSWSLSTTESGALRSKAGAIPAVGDGEAAALAQLGIGQGRMLLTPLHMALAVSAIAADGVLQAPRLLADDSPRRTGRFCRAETARDLRRLMRSVVRTGTARAADVEGLEVAGKTGTAQVGHGDDHAWFVCMAPVSSPKLALAVVVEHGGYGASAALPVALEILRLADRLGLLHGERSAGGPE